MVKESTLEAIGYICQDIQDHRCLEVMSNEILTAIVHGMKKDEPSPHVRLAATNALLNSLEFTRANFETDVSTHYHGNGSGILYCGTFDSKDIHIHQNIPPEKILLNLETEFRFQNRF